MNFECQLKIYESLCFGRTCFIINMHVVKDWKISFITSERIILLSKNKNRILYAKTTLLWPVFLYMANEVPIFGHKVVLFHQTAVVEKYHSWDTCDFSVKSQPCQSSVAFWSTFQSPVKSQPCQNLVKTNFCQTPIKTNFCQNPVKTNFCQTPVETNFWQSPVKTNFCQSPVKTDFCQSPVKTDFCQVNV